MTASLRLLIDTPLSGSTNMARDEALLDAAGSGNCPATLRFYRWSAPTVSLGYFQAYAEFESSGQAERLAVVRRTTGGGAILHDRELTYSLAVGKSHSLLVDGATNLYHLIHDPIIDVLASIGISARLRGSLDGAADSCGDSLAKGLSKGRGKGRSNDRDNGRDKGRGGASDEEPFFCFARAHPLDIVADGLKLVGSAQRRAADAVLQHGSIMLEATHDLQPTAAVWDGARIETDDLSRRIAERFAVDNGLSLRSAGWTESELRSAGSHAVRYNSPAWTRRR